MDSAQYKNWLATVGVWKKAELRQRELLENVIPQREQSARALLGMRDTPPIERRKAEEILAQCARHRAKLQASLDGAKPLIKTYEKGIEDYERQRERRMSGAKL